MQEKLRCNICNEIIDLAEVGQHVVSRNHAVKKKVAEFHEMNAQLNNGRSIGTGKTNNDNDISVISAWLGGLYVHDYLSLGSSKSNGTNSVNPSDV